MLYYSIEYMLSNVSTNVHTYYFLRSDRVYSRCGGVGIMIHNDFCIISSSCLVFSYVRRNTSFVISIRTHTVSITTSY